MFIVEIQLVFSELWFIISNQAIVDEVFEVRYGTRNSRPVELYAFRAAACIEPVSDERKILSYLYKQIDMTPL